MTPLRQREPRAGQPFLRFDSGRRTRRLGVSTLVFLRVRPSRRLGQLAGRTVDAALRVLDRAMEMNRNPERAARRFSLGMLSRNMPGPMRNALGLVRGVASIGLRQR